MTSTRHQDEKQEARNTEPPSERKRLLQWHRLFGISLVEAFVGSPWRVELEKELALKSQLLDVVIIESEGDGENTTVELPDGLENLRPHNLLTYKSLHEALNPWALDELIGHYVNYRKLRADSRDTLPSESDFGLYAVATRTPEVLKRIDLQQPTGLKGIYDVPWGSQVVRVIVLNEVEQAERNAYWELFASEQDRMWVGLNHYRARQRTPGQIGYWELLEQILIVHQRENTNMAYTMKEFLRETHEMVLANMTPEERLKGLDPEERLRGLDPEERLRGLDPEERLKGLDPDEVLQRFDPALIEAWLAKHRQKH